MRFRVGKITTKREAQVLGLLYILALLQLLLRFPALEAGFDRCHEVFNTPDTPKQAQVMKQT